MSTQDTLDMLHPTTRETLELLRGDMIAAVGQTLGMVTFSVAEEQNIRALRDMLTHDLVEVVQEIERDTRERTRDAVFAEVHQIIAERKQAHRITGVVWRKVRRVPLPRPVRERLVHSRRR